MKLIGIEKIIDFKKKYVIIYNLFLLKTIICFFFLTPIDLIYIDSNIHIFELFF